MKASSKRKRKESSEGDGNKQRTLLSFFSTSPQKKLKNENGENENHNRANDDLVVEEEDAMIAVPSATSSTLPSLSRGSNRRTTNGATKSAAATSSLHHRDSTASQALPAFTARASGRHGTGRTAGGGAPSMASSLRRRNHHHHLGGGSGGGPRPLLLPGDTIMPRGAGGRWQQEEVEAAVMDRILSDRDVYDADPAQPKSQDVEPDRASLLSDEQRAALQVALDGVSFFFTGSAGTGKSFLLKEMITQLRRKHRDGIFVTASTGVAACNIGGVTLHGFAGVGLANGSAESLASQVTNAKWTLARWRSAKVLVVDEVSMLEAEFFDKMEKVARIVRDSHLPFGGIQIILCGDFLQLPPVVKGRDHKFCFQADCWSSVIKRTIILQQVFRQADEQFVGILNQIRVGYLSPEARRILEGRLLGPGSTAAAATKQPEPDSAGESEGEASGEREKEIVATRLYSHRRDVDAENVKCLQDINTESHTFYAEDEGTNPYLKQLQQNCPAPYELELKVGAQVILLKNLDFENELVNGARGLVVEFRKPDRSEREKERDKAFAKQEYPDVLFANGHRRVLTPEQFSVEVGGSVKASRKQVPLGLAWALSIHKSQGMTISKVELHLGNVFEYGQAYVALSRATSLEGLRLLSFNPAGIKAHPRVLQFYQSLLGRPLFADQSSQPTTISTTTTTTTTASSAPPPRTAHGDRGGMSFPSSAPAPTTTRSSAVSLRSTASSSSSSSSSTFSFAPASSSASRASPYFASPVPTASSPILLRGRKGGSPHQKRSQTHTAAPSAPGAGAGAQTSETTKLANDAADDLFFWQHFVAQELDFSAASAAASSSPYDSSPASSAGGAAAGGELLSSPPSSSVSTTPASSQSQRELERREDEQATVEVEVPEDLGHAMEEEDVPGPADDASHNDAQDETRPSQQQQQQEEKMEEDQDAEAEAEAEAEEKQKESGEGREEAAPRAEERVFLSARDLLRRLAGGGPRGDDHREKGV